MGEDEEHNMSAMRDAADAMRVVQRATEYNDQTFTSMAFAQVGAPGLRVERLVISRARVVRSSVFNDAQA